MDQMSLKELLRRLESRTLDFKATAYKINSEETRAEFIKDILCMANTPRENDAHIVLGVKKHADGTATIIGMHEHVDEATLQSQLTERVYPIPYFSYEVVDYEGKKVGIITIPPKRIGPCVPTRDFGELLHRGQVYFRRGSKNDAALSEDLFEIIDWVRGNDSIVKTASVPGISAWDTFLDAVHGFEPNRRYVLITSPIRHEALDIVSALGQAPWTAVLDFDPVSESGGLLEAAKDALTSHRSLHRVVSGERPTVVPDRATHWFFARGLDGRVSTLVPGKWKDWVQRYQLEIAQQLKDISSACAPSPITCVVLSYDNTVLRYVQTCVEAAIGAFGESVDFVLVARNPVDVHDLAGEVDAQVVDIPLSQLCAGIRAHLNIDSAGDTGLISLPSSSGAPTLLDGDKQRWLEEELELLHLSSGLVPEHGRETGREFLRGAEITWYELGCHEDVERDKTTRLRQQLATELGSKRTVRVNLYHAPGAGGTTLGKRILWDFHRNYPCTILLRCDPLNTAERLYYLASLTGQAVLVLVDGARIAERQVDDLVEQLRSRHVPAVILQVLRRFRGQVEGERALFLHQTLSLAESYRFMTAFSKAEPSKKAILESLISSDDTMKRTAFYFGLTAFEEDFRGIEPYVRARLKGLTEVQRKILGYLAMAHHYGQRGLPTQAFAPLLGVPRNRTLELRRALPEGALELVIQDGDRGWRTTHELVAKEILVQTLLKTPTLDRDLWTQSLSAFSLEFAEFCRGESAIASDEMLEIARRTFIYRDNTDVLGTERAGQQTFAQLIEDIPSHEGRLEVLRGLVRLYPQEAHFWAHLGRFYSIVIRNYGQAVLAIDKAISLQEDDPVLHHMKGMALRYQMYGLVQEHAELDAVVRLAEQSSEAFESARRLNSDDEHAYISEVQLLIRVLDYAGRLSGGDLLKYLALPTANRFVRTALERAEELLEHVRRNREGEGASPFEETCRAQLDQLYGRHDRALQTWDGLLSQAGVYQPPLRRQIVWTYLARRDRSWDRLEPGEVQRIITLLEQNLEEEPHTDKNLRLWVQAVRRSKFPPSLEAILEKVGYWRTNSNSLDAVYYLYVLNALLAISGSGLAREESKRYLEECRHQARYRRNRTKSIEWLGNGTGINRLVYHTELGEWVKEREFWDRPECLARVRGRISRYDGPQAGQIELAGGLTAFFVPARGGFTRESVNEMVDFYAGFSYDGIRAWEVRPVA